MFEGFLLKGDFLLQFRQCTFELIQFGARQKRHSSPPGVVMYFAAMAFLASL